MAKTEFSRLVWKRSSTTGVEPTIPSDETISEDWLTTDLLIGEGFINTVDERIWYRSSNGIVEIDSSGVGVLDSTTDATPLEVSVIPVTEDSALLVDAEVMAINDDGSRAANIHLRSVYRNEGGVVNLVGLNSKVANSDFTTLTSDLTISTTNITVVVTGEAATNVNWSVKYKLSYVNV